MNDASRDTRNECHRPLNGRDVLASEILDQGLQQCALAHFGWTDDGHDDRRRFHGRPVHQRNVLLLRLQILRPVETFLGLGHRLDGESFRIALLGILLLDVRILGLLLLRFASYLSKKILKMLKRPINILHLPARRSRCDFFLSSMASAMVAC
jgi:hypothetical protein